MIRVSLQLVDQVAERGFSEEELQDAVRTVYKRFPAIAAAARFAGHDFVDANLTMNQELSQLAKKQAMPRVIEACFFRDKHCNTCPSSWAAEILIESGFGVGTMRCRVFLCKACVDRKRGFKVIDAIAPTHESMLTREHRLESL